MTRTSSNDSGGHIVKVVVILLVAAVVGGGAYVWWRQRVIEGGLEPEVAPTTAVVLDAGVTDRPALADASDVAEDAGVVELPRDPDAALGAIVRMFSHNEALLRLSSTDGILKRLVAATWLISEGRSPRSVLSFLPIDGDFQVLDKEDGLYVDPASYRRYDGVVSALMSVDPAEAAKAYRLARPYLDRAFAEVATHGERFDDVLSVVLRRLTRVRVPKESPRLEERGATFLYADAALEELSPPEKHLLRMGRKNARRVQRFLKTFGVGAGLLAPAP